MRTIENDEIMRLRAPGELVALARDVAASRMQSLSEFVRQSVRKQIEAERGVRQ